MKIRKYILLISLVGIAVGGCDLPVCWLGSASNLFPILSKTRAFAATSSSNVQAVKQSANWGSEVPWSLIALSLRTELPAAVP